VRINRGDGILKVMIIIFLLIVSGNAIEYFFVKKEDLQKVTGSVSEVILKTYDCPGVAYYKYKCEKTTIKIENVKGVFHIADYYDRGAYLDTIEKGDFVTIYIRRWYQYILTLGAGKDIYGLEKNGVSYYDIGRWKRSNKAFMIIFGVLSIFFGALYILQRITVNELIKSKRV